MKRTVCAVVCSVLLACLMSGCVGEGEVKNGGLKIVTMIFPEYDWVREIMGEKAADAELTMLLGSGVDLHSFQPTTDDIIKISSCDVLVYTGGESDAWVEDVLSDASNPDMEIVKLTDVLGDRMREEEIREGMEEHEDEHGEEAEYDEHVWLSLKNAEILCAALADKLSEADPSNADIYNANANEYIAKLRALDEDYRAAVESAAIKTVLFADRFPFRYMTDDYGLEYYAAFAGCSAETEADFETIVFLAEKADKLGLKTILTAENPRHTIAETVVDNTAAKNAEILEMDSMQSVTAKEAANGITYLSVMESNLEVLKKALR